MRSKYNKNCSSIVIVCYPPGAGGKFLINSLGLSQSCYLQDIYLLKQQRKRTLPSEQKLNFILHRLSREQENWNDLGLGCKQLFGNVLDPESFYSEILEVSYEDKLFFVVAHRPGKSYDGVNGLIDLLNIWPNAKKIYLKNSNEFVNWRLGFAKGFDRSSYPQIFQNFTDYEEKQILQEENLLIWDVNWYFDQEKFIHELKNLYEQLGIVDFDQELVQTYYCRYIEKIEELRNIKKKLYID